MTKALDAIDLLPCPFCGGPAHVNNSRDSYFMATCTKCACHYAENFGTRAEAVAAWNRRHEPTAEVRQVAEEIVNSMYACCEAPETEYDADGRAVGYGPCCGKPNFIGADKEQIAAIISARLSPAPTGLAAEFGKLAEKATQGNWARSGVRDKRRMQGEDCIVLCLNDQGVGYFPTGRNGAQHLEAFNDVAFIAWCFNHRTDIARALISTQEKANENADVACAHGAVPVEDFTAKTPVTDDLADAIDRHLRQMSAFQWESAPELDPRPLLKRARDHVQEAENRALERVARIVERSAGLDPDDVAAQIRALKHTEQKEKVG